MRSATVGVGIKAPAPTASTMAPKASSRLMAVEPVSRTACLRRVSAICAVSTPSCSSVSTSIRIFIASPPRIYLFYLEFLGKRSGIRLTKGKAHKLLTQQIYACLLQLTSLYKKLIMFGCTLLVQLLTEGILP